MDELLLVLRVLVLAERQINIRGRYLQSVDQQYFGGPFLELLFDLLVLTFEEVLIDLALLLRLFVVLLTGLLQHHALTVPVLNLIFRLAIIDCQVELLTIEEIVVPNFNHTAQYLKHNSFSNVKLDRLQLNYQIAKPITSHHLLNRRSN